MKVLFIIIVFTFIMSACSTGKMISEGYLVSIEQGKNFTCERFSTNEKVDSFIVDKTNLNFDTDKLIGNKDLYWDFSNDEIYLYVEKQGLYQRKEKSKKRWKIYNIKQK